MAINVDYAKNLNMNSVPLRFENLNLKNLNDVEDVIYTINSDTYEKLGLKDSEKSFNDVQKSLKKSKKVVNKSETKSNKFAKIGAIAGFAYSSGTYNALKKTGYFKRGLNIIENHVDNFNPKLAAAAMIAGTIIGTAITTATGALYGALIGKAADIADKKKAQ